MAMGSLADRKIIERNKRERWMMKRQSARPKKSLVMATTQRCGGSWLASLMESTGSLGHPEEWLIPATVLRWGVRHRIPALKLRAIPNCVLYRSGLRNDREPYAVYKDAVNPRAVQRYLNQLAQNEITPNSVFSAHLQWDQMEVLAKQWNGSFLDLAEQNHWLFLWREDQLEQTISWYRARATGQWNSVQRAEKAAVYDGPELRRRFQMTVRRNEQWVEFFELHGITPFELTYEQVQRDPDRSIEAILDFVGEQPSTVAGTKQRELKVQRSSETEEWILRFAEESPDLMDQRYRPFR
jgi:LPS sulfotransferase NodH